MNEPCTTSGRSYGGWKISAPAWRLRWLILGMTFAGALHGSPAWAQPTESETAGQSEDTERAVTELMRTAVARYAKKDLEGAREAFEKAWNLKHHAAIAASLAEVEMKLSRY